ncbi:hypothetical protein GCM10012275_53320 [Longimycelium tulufanense]|uniref:Uncharacterized protein n=1 Tax=Longimycelium tulufanense TaxID=907463 RepID=A0A8J3CJ22_9PSEU|nr:hypothetical protein GCM10012275_53320 [Longimycelium tulufanense]
MDDPYQHTVDYWPNLWATLRNRAPRARCGANLATDEPPDGPPCPRCAAGSHSGGRTQ